MCVTEGIGKGRGQKSPKYRYIANSDSEKLS
jgi:hypothetical protein